MQHAYDVIAYDPEIHRINRFSVWPSEPGRVAVCIQYLAPREERKVTIDSDMSADWHGLALVQALSQLTELGHVDYCRGEHFNDPSIRGWNYATHAKSKSETRAWLSSLWLATNIGGC